MLRVNGLAVDSNDRVQDISQPGYAFEILYITAVQLTEFGFAGSTLFRRRERGGS